MPDDQETRDCHRCRAQKATTNVRQDRVCRDCFLRYVYQKTVKRMDTVRRIALGDQKKLLLAYSSGVSSLTLLAVLDQHLNIRAGKSGQRPYTLHVLHVEDDSLTTDLTTAGDVFQGVRVRFPSHEYTSIRLSDALDLDSTPKADTNDSTDENASPRQRLLRYLSTAGSPTHVLDLKSNLRTCLIAHFATCNPCDGILYGDSTTRLAEKTMSETAKGRGGSLPWMLADDQSDSRVDSEAHEEKMIGSNHPVSTVYPMRDLLKKELVVYCQLTEPPLMELVRTLPSSTSGSTLSARNSTIDELMTAYFETVEKDYPNIVANVVRTVAKLHAPETE